MSGFKEFGWNGNVRDPVNILKEFAWEDEKHLSLPKSNIPHDAILYHNGHLPLKSTKISPEDFHGMGIYSRSFRPEHLEAIKDYKDDSMGINAHLRQGLDPPNPTMSQLQYITNYKLTSPTTLYRGNKFEYALPVGNKLTDLGFTGTTLAPQTASFAFGNKHRIFAIHSPAGLRAYHIDSHPNNLDNEDEVLLHPATHFEVVAHTKHPILLSLRRNTPSGAYHKVTHLVATGQGIHPNGDLHEFPNSRVWKDYVTRNHNILVTK